MIGAVNVMDFRAFQKHLYKKHHVDRVSRSLVSILCFAFFFGSSIPFAQSQTVPENSSIIAFQGLVEPKLSPGPSDFLIQTWSVREGLPRVGVTAIAQTPDGFLWLGLERGLVRFDGVNLNFSRRKRILAL